MRYVLILSILIIGGCATTTTADKGQSFVANDAGVPAVVEGSEDELWMAYEEVCNNSMVNIMERRGQHSRGGKTITVDGQSVTIFCE